MKPPLKWTGSKVRLVPEIRKLLPAWSRELRHCEPFAGGAALFFAEEPERAWLSDANPDLINAYHQLQAYPSHLLDELRCMCTDYASQDSLGRALTYQAARRTFNGDTKYPPEPLERAALLLFLNRTCFNGLWRVNSAGDFNVPHGSRKTFFYPDLLRAAAKLLARPGVEVLPATFDLCSFGEGDLVYLDPPYAPETSESFTAYTGNGFSAQDHSLLAARAQIWAAAGAAVIISNSDTPLVRSLYRDAREIRTVSASRAAGGGSRGGSRSELLIRI